MDYEKNLVEVDEVLNYMDKELLMKIPEEVRQKIKEKKDKDYVFSYDTSKKLNEQNISRDSVAILSYLSMKYLFSEEQKVLIEKLHVFNEKKKKINTFRKSGNFKKNKIETNDIMAISKIENEKWYKKIFLVMKKILKKN